MNDPLNAVFETPEQSLALFLKSMPPSLVPVFEREFMRRKEAAALQAENARLRELVEKARNVAGAWKIETVPGSFVSEALFVVEIEALCAALKGETP